EPTEHLDVETSEALMDDLWATTPGAAKLVITHDPLVMERCDRVWELG
ncbi:MAG: ABC transporter ATP-binding protein, partial [Cutibacterium granulosum]|nr:ABC transporter ATP-binding protein [Cutibacterium granulosum]